MLSFDIEETVRHNSMAMSKRNNQNKQENY